jgi:hypothetical protein
MTLHEDKTLFSDVIAACAEAMGIPEVYIEKDYWLCYLLKKLSNSSYKEQVVFKGGTSLSKVYKIIERFSEDIDLGLFPIRRQPPHLIILRSKFCAQKIWTLKLCKR